MGLTPAANAVFSQSSRLRRRIAGLICAIAIGSTASTAMAASEAKSKVIRCGTENCLLVSGHRDDPASIVSINGHPVAAEGKRRWQVRLPVETVREWSAPHARSIEISLLDPETRSTTIASVDLPIGLLGHVTDLAVLEISIR